MSVEKRILIFNLDPEKKKVKDSYLPRRGDGPHKQVSSGKLEIAYFLLNLLNLKLRKIRKKKEEDWTYSS